MKALNELNFKFLKSIRTKEELKKYLISKGLTNHKINLLVEDLKSSVYEDKNFNNLSIDQLKQVSGGVIKLNYDHNAKKWNAEANPSKQLNYDQDHHVLVEGKVIDLNSLTHDQLKEIADLKKVLIDNQQENVPAYAEDKNIMDQAHSILVKRNLKTSVGLLFLEAAIVSSALIFYTFNGNKKKD